MKHAYKRIVYWTSEHHYPGSLNLPFWVFFLKGVVFGLIIYHHHPFFLRNSCNNQYHQFLLKVDYPQSTGLRYQEAIQTEEPPAARRRLPSSCPSQAARAARAAPRDRAPRRRVRGRTRRERLRRHEDDGAGGPRRERLRRHEDDGPWPMVTTNGRRYHRPRPRP